MGSEFVYSGQNTYLLLKQSSILNSFNYLKSVKNSNFKTFHFEILGIYVYLFFKTCIFNVLLLNYNLLSVKNYVHNLVKT